MSNRRRRRPWKQSIDGPFAPRRIEMLESPAYRVLSLWGHMVISRLEIELKNHGGADNGKLPVTFKQFVEYGVPRRRIAPAIRETAALGFQEVTRKGRAGNAEFRASNWFRLTFRHMDRASPTDEWKRIDTMEQAKAIAEMARKAGKSARLKKQNSSPTIGTGFGDTIGHRKRPIPGDTIGHYSQGSYGGTTSISRGGRRGRSAVVSIRDLSNGFDPHALPRALWVTAAPNPENPDHAIALIALEGDVP
jgi:hypothetical protein